MDKDKCLKKRSASTTDVEAATKKSKREFDDSVIVILKKQRKEIEEINHSLKDMSELMKTLHDNSLRKSDLEDILLKVKETPNKKVEPIYECCFEVEGAEENDWDTIFVNGFDCSLSRDDIKSTLKKHFGSCGEVKRVFVPIECKTGSSLGFAFLDLRRNPEKALLLNGSYLGGLKLEVVMARERDEYDAYPKFDGCKRCSIAFNKRRFSSFIETCGGRLYPWERW